MNPPEDTTITWRKSSYTGGNGDCVEIALAPTSVAIRDSKHTTGPVLDFPPAPWHAFLTTTKTTC